MRMSPFTPKGDKARWRVIYDLLRGAAVGDIVSYQTLGEQLHLDPVTDRHTIQMAIRRAAREYETEDKHALEVVPNHGYRVVEAERHIDLAKKQQKKAGKALVRGRSKVINVDLSHVDPEVRTAFQVLAQAFSLQVDMSRRLEVNQQKLQQAVKEIGQQVQRSDDERREILERLDRIERRRQ
jgi:hypothetical protein